HSLYILGGIDQYYLVNPHYTLPYSDAAPLSSLRSFYLEAQQRYGVNASYLASINFIESKFGRVNGPSSANAYGPMQFLTGTWQEYGQGGNIMDPHDSILAAARLLVHNGAPYNMRNAIWHYNQSFDYVDSVELFARAYRSDPGWLDRLKRIKELQQQGFTLTVIQRCLAGELEASDEALVAAVTRPAAPQALTLGELSERSGVAEPLLMTLQQAGLLVPIEGGEEPV